jgi:hemerythrin-like metal-binding protein
MTTELATAAATSPSLVWSEELVLGLPAIDQTHVEFVELLAATEMADDDQLLQRLQALTDHTVDHFGREDQWMATTAFAPVNCHGMQHQVVLQTLDELLRRGREEGDLALVRSILPELGKWFAQHAQTMDAALAWHLDQVGFDETTGQMSRPPSAQAPAESGCGSTSCAS